MHLRSLLVATIATVVCTTAGYTYYQKTSAGDALTAKAAALVASLDDQQRSKAVLEYDSPKRVGWHFIPINARKGLMLREMSKDQQTAAHDVLKSALSKMGYDKTTKIMELERLLAALEKDATFHRRDPLKYYFTFFGEPTADGRWGLSVEGHHLSLNFVIEKGEFVSSSPQFFAANPATVMDDYIPSVKKGQAVLEKEEQLAFDLVSSLNDTQKAKAIIAEKAPREIRAAGEPQPPQEKPVGLAVSGMSGDQREVLEKLIDEYIHAVPAEVAEARKEALAKSGVENIHFAWAGATKPGVGHYYRIEGETFLIEFVNTQPDAAGNPANHIHAVWRDPRGDFALEAK
jgi:hypothetical protein